MKWHRLALVAALMGVSDGTLGAQSSPVGSFRPLVVAPDSGGRCEAMSPAVLRAGETGALLRFGTVPDSGRVVSTVWDSTGTLLRYGDVRGDLRGPPTPPTARGLRTSILIDFREGSALLLNEKGTRGLGNMMTSASAALNAAHLGPPSALLARLHAECGSPAGTKR